MYKHDFKNSISIIRDKIQGKTIVYCKTQKDTEKFRMLLIIEVMFQDTIMQD